MTGRLLAWAVAVVVGSIVAVVAFAPASLADWGLRQATAGRLALAETQGRVWQGSGRLVLIDVNDRTVDRATLAGVAVPGRVRWAVRMLPLFVGVVDARLTIEGTGEPVRLTGSFSEVRIGAGSLSLPAVDLSRLGSPWNTIRPAGALSIRWDGLTLREGSFDGRADIELRDMASALTPVRPLGSYKIAVVGEGASAKLDISTLSGPLLLEGNGTWTARRGVNFSALASAEERERARLQSLLSLMGQRQGDKTLIRIGA